MNPPKPGHLRIARPVSDLAMAQALYCQGLGLRVIGAFADHAGFDGVMLGAEGAGFHFEFTRSRWHPLTPTPTVEDLIVFYIADGAGHAAACARMLAAGFRAVAPLNPFWDRHGRTFEDTDGYRVVLQNTPWPA